MVAVINTFEKNNVKYEIVYTKVKGENLPDFLKKEGIELSCDKDGKHIEVFLFNTDEEAEKCMGSK